MAADGRCRGGRGELVGPGAAPRRRRPRSRRRPSRRGSPLRSRRACRILHAGDPGETAGRRVQEVGPAALDAGERGQPAGLDRRPDRLQRQRQRPPPMMLMVTPPPACDWPKARVSARGQHPLAASGRSPAPRAAAGRRRRRRQEAGDTAGMHPRRAGEGECRNEPLWCGRTDDPARMQHAGEGRSEAAEHTAERVRDRTEHEAPHRDLGEIGEDRGDEIAHPELAGLDELSHRILGAAETADQRIADALAGLLGLVGVVSDGLHSELPAGSLLPPGPPSPQAPPRRSLARPP